MQDHRQNAQDCAARPASRLVLRHAADDLGDVGAPAQEVPNLGANRAPFARALRDAMDARFAGLNAGEGLIVAARLRPRGVIWRIHPAAGRPSADAGAPLASEPVGALA